MKRCKTLLALITVICICLSMLGGCSLKQLNAKSYALLVEGNLSCLYLGEVSDEYLGIISDTKEACLESYENGLRTEADYFADYFKCDLGNCSEAAVGKVIELYREIYSHSRFEVGEAVYSDGKYLVDVTVYPINIIVSSFDEVLEFYKNYCAQPEESYSDAPAEADRSAVEEGYVLGVVEIISGYLDELGYNEATTVTVKVEPDSDGVYSINSDDLGKIDSLIIAY